MERLCEEKIVKNVDCLLSGRVGTLIKRFDFDRDVEQQEAQRFVNNGDGERERAQVALVVVAEREREWQKQKEVVD